MVGDLRDLAGRDKSAHGDEIPVAWCEPGPQPEIAEENIGRILNEARRDLPELLSDTRRPLFLRRLVERKLRSGGRREFIAPDLRLLKTSLAAGIAFIAFAHPV